MQLEYFITPANVINVATCILNLDSSAIAECYASDMHAMIAWLQECLGHVISPRDRYYPWSITHTDATEHAFNILIHAVNSVWPCLTLEAQAQLHGYLMASTVTRISA